MYVERIAQVVSWCSEQDIYVIIDFHQDNYGYGVPNGGADGAPIWASPTPDELNSTAAAIPAITRDVLQAIGHGLFNPILAFDRFWHNALVNSTKKGLQEHYILAAAHLARRFLANPTVLGYEVRIHSRRLRVMVIANDTTGVLCDARTKSAALVHFDCSDRS